MLRKKKKFERPRRIYDKLRIEEENELVKKYGLKNKREIWKAESAIRRIRRQAKRLITSSKEKQEELFKKLNRIGFKVSKTADVLALNKEDWLKRRLQSILIKKNYAKPKEARQLIAHKHVAINGKIVNVPGYTVRVDEEEGIVVFKKQKKEKIDKNKVDDKEIIKKQEEEKQND